MKPIPIYVTKIVKTQLAAVHGFQSQLANPLSKLPILPWKRFPVTGLINTWPASLYPIDEINISVACLLNILSALSPPFSLTKTLEIDPESRKFTSSIRRSRMASGRRPL
jgi:hypothetical protein